MMENELLQQTHIQLGRIELRIALSNTVLATIWGPENDTLDSSFLTVFRESRPDDTMHDVLCR